jgi:hypothetical protein
MENNIRPDKVDDFVRKSFENYEENPPEERWNKISAALNQAASPEVLPIKPAFAWKNYLAAAAIVLLSVGLVVEHFYFSNKIKEIKDDVASKNTQNKVKDKEHASISTNIKAAESNIEQIVATPFSKENLQPSKKIQSSKISQSFNNTSRSLNTSTAQVFDTEKGFVFKEVSSVNNTINDNLNALYIVNLETNSSQNLIDKEVVIQSTEISTTTANVEKVELTKWTILPFLTNNQLNQVFFEGKSDLKIASMPIKVHREKSGWYLSANIFQRYEKERSGFRDQGNPNELHHFSNEEDHQNTLDFGINIGKKIKNRFGFETGLVYNNSNQMRTHTPDFKKRDGHGGPHGGGNDHDFDFDYDLHTYGGTSAVSFRVEQIDPNVMIDDEEPLKINVSTEEKIQIIRVPFWATYTLGKGRLLMNTKAGVSANVFLKNKVEITDLSTQSTQFRIKPDFAPTNDFQKPSTLKLAYLFSTGLEYRLNTRWSLLPDLFLSGDIKGQNNQNRFEANRMAVGINLAAKVRI